MPIKVEAINVPRPLSATEARRLRKMVREQLEHRGSFGRSASGQSLAFAVEWCEEFKHPYIIIAYPNAGGYFLETVLNYKARNGSLNDELWVEQKSPREGA